jgi:hypothetical protein
MSRASFLVPAAVNTWSMADIRRLRELAAAGLHIKQISLALHRTESAVRNKAAMHCISLGNTPRPESSPVATESATITTGIEDIDSAEHR